MLLKSLAFFAALAVSFSAHANLEIAGIAQVAQTHFDLKDLPGVDVKNGTNTRIGALLFLPVLPTLSLRTGAIYHDRKMKSEITGFGDITTTDKLLEVPLNLQWNIPVTSAFVYGGLMFDLTQKTECDAPAGFDCKKTPNDTAVNIGAGYNLVSFGLIRWAIEIEHQRGTKDLVDGAGEIKQSNWALGTVLAFGF